MNKINNKFHIHNKYNKCSPINRIKIKNKNKNKHFNKINNKITTIIKHNIHNKIKHNILTNNNNIIKITNIKIK